MSELIIVISNDCKLNDLKELDIKIRKLYGVKIKYSHINHLYNNELNISEYVYGLHENKAILESKDLNPLLKLENVLGFYVIV